MSSGRLFFAVCLAFSGYFVYTATAGTLRTHNIARNEAAATRRVEQLELDRAYLEAVVHYASSDAYVEQEARRTLGYVRDGEIAIVVTSPAPAADLGQGGEWWERLFPR